ncbi:helix-turn-helix domain-containing protein [Streptomyces sp. NBC_01288]|uniref:hypothetical protein n=1 Tax=Streptomyces sp. NBC_01288 TaxID=2903814 RepID=UPI002E125D09|nr:helix-turn-helix domain-containing protein [Streptomyces sp. NBC_01288]
MTPTPADLARRIPVKPGPPTTAPSNPSTTAARPAKPSSKRALTAEEAIAPGRLGPDERFKSTFHLGLLRSGMLPEARLVGFTLLWYAHHRTGRISPNFQPSAEQLASDTGLNTASVGVQLEVLRQRGWLRLTPIAEGPRTGLPRFELTIPALHLQRIRAHRAELRLRDQSS